MDLKQLEQGLAELYPPLRTRSGATIKTAEVTGDMAPEGLSVTLKTLYPPSDRRRSEFVVTSEAGDLHVRPVDVTATADAQRFAELVRTRWQGAAPDEPLAPLRLVKDGAGRYAFRVGRTKLAPEREIATDPATPQAVRRTLPPEKRSSQKGQG